MLMGWSLNKSSVLTAEKTICILTSFIKASINSEGEGEGSGRGRGKGTNKHMDIIKGDCDNVPQYNSQFANKRSKSMWLGSPGRNTEGGDD